MPQIKIGDRFWDQNVYLKILPKPGVNVIENYCNGCDFFILEHDANREDLLSRSYYATCSYGYFTKSKDRTIHINKNSEGFQSKIWVIRPTLCNTRITARDRFEKTKKLLKEMNASIDVEENRFFEWPQAMGVEGSLRIYISGKHYENGAARGFSCIPSTVLLPNIVFTSPDGNLNFQQGCTCSACIRRAKIIAAAQGTIDENGVSLYE